MLAHKLFTFKDSTLLNCHKIFTSFNLIILFILFLAITLFSARAHAVERQLIFDPSLDERVIGYNLYYGQSENFDTVVDLKNSTSHFLEGLEENTTYYFAATAYDSYGNESVLSDVLVYHVSENITEQKTLIFDASPDERVVGYNLHYGQSHNFDITVDLHNNTSYILPYLDECETYYFAASAYDVYGNESVLSDVLVYTVGDCTQQFFLDTGVDPSGSGTIIKEPDQESYSSNSQVSLTATAAFGYEFSHWGGELSGSENPVTVTMNSNKSVTAHFTAIVETVSAPSVPEGSTSGTVGLKYAYYPSGSSSNLGHPVEYQFDWGDGYYSNWSGSGNVSHTWSSAGTYSVRAQARSVSDVSVVSEWSDSLSVTISPALVPHTVDTNPTGLEIVVNGASYTAPQTFEWEAGTSHTLSVPSPQSMTYDERYVFSSWNNGGSRSHTITALSSTTTYIASFAVQYSLTTSGGSDGEGTVSPSGVNWYNEGENVSISATAGSCYEFTHWSGDLSGSENPATIVMSASKSVSAHFSYMEPLPKTLVFDPSPDERVVGYKLYYGQTEQIEMIVDLGNNTSYELIGLEEGATYYFAATAYDKHGNESDFSEILTYTVPETYAACSIINSDPIISDQHILEMGEVFINHQWQRVDFNGIFIDPIVVAKPASLNDPKPGVVRIRNVDEFGFEIRMQVWDYLHDSPDYEDVSISYLAMEKGVYVLPGGIMMEAGSFEADGSKFTPNPFVEDFNYVPVVIASITTINEENAVTGRIQNVTSGGFEYLLQQQDRNSRGRRAVVHGTERVSFIACEPFSGNLNGITIEIGTTGNQVNHDFFDLTYTETFAKVPYFLADMQTTNEKDTANIRYRNKNLYGVEIQISEEQSQNRDVQHENENVGYFIISK